MKLATKLPARLVESAQDFDRYFNEQLERLQTEKVDFYLLHGLDSKNWAKVRDLGVLRWVEGKIADGQIDYLGFSFHDDYKVFKEIVDAYNNWTLCQIQYNYLDITYQAGTRGLRYAAANGLAVVVMEPLRGGHLAQEPPEQVRKVWAGATQKRTLAEWGLLWVLDHPEVSVTLSGMSNMEQVAENVAVADNSGPGTLTTGELALIGKVRKACRGLTPVPCTDCRYCMPCPNGVEIPRIFRIYNDAVMWDDPRTGRFLYRGSGELKEEQRADQCHDCRECVEACPQDVPIPEWLKKAHALLGPKQ